MDLALNNLQRLICHKTNQTKPLGARSAEYGGLGGTEQPNSNIFCWTWLCVMEKHVSTLNECGSFLRLLCALQFKNSKGISWWLHHTKSITFMKLCFWSRLLRFIHVDPLPFALNIVIKDPFFITCNDIFEKLVISLPWKKICSYGYAIFHFLFTMRNQTSFLFTFPSSGRLWIGVYWG